MVGEGFKDKRSDLQLINFLKACEERRSSATMKSLVTPTMLCIALFIIKLDAAPVLPSGHEADDEFEAVGRQQSDEMGKTFLNAFSKVLTAANDRIGRGSQIQSNNERKVLNLLGNLGSALQKKANPEDNITQTFLSLFNTLVSGAKDGNGGGQEAHVDTTAKRFDQIMLESMDENAAMMEADADLTDEAKMQAFGAILGTIATGVLGSLATNVANRFFSGNQCS